MIRLPGLVDVHVHMRDPGATHKEDWDSGTAAALTGGFTQVLAMPNTDPPIIDAESLAEALALAGAKARCDYAQYVGATSHNAAEAARLAPRVAGLKIYLNETFGELRLAETRALVEHLENWPPEHPLAVHAEGATMERVLEIADGLGRAVHVCHVARRDEIELIRSYKERGAPVTCEVSPHHLFLGEENVAGIGRSRVRPPLATAPDRRALWEHLEAIDCFATDHAPHTLEEKDGPAAPPGFPGLETALPLLLTAVGEGRLELDDVTARLHDNPRRIFGLPEQPDTYAEIDPDERWVIRGGEARSRCGWTPFEGCRVTGRVRQVVVRGREAFRDGRVIAPVGSGRNIREHVREESKT